MELPVGLIALGVLAVVAAGWYIGRVRRQRREAGWRQLALKLQGQVVATSALGPGAATARHVLRFPIRSQVGFVIWHEAGASWNRRRWLEIRLPWRADSFAARFASPEFTRRDLPEPWPRSVVAETLLGPGLEVRTRETDERVVVALGRSDQLRQRLRELLGAPNSGRLLVRFERDGLTITKPVSHRRPLEFESLVRQADEFFDAAVIGDSTGIEIDGADVHPDSATCPVCGEGVEPEQLVLCARCLTPHHRDCWDFNHKCALYGCKSNERSDPSSQAS